MKVVDFILSVLMAIVGFGLVFAYACEGQAFFSLLWAGISALSVSNAALRGVVIWVEKF